MKNSTFLTIERYDITIIIKLLLYNEKLDLNISNRIWEDKNEQ